MATCYECNNEIESGFETAEGHDICEDCKDEKYFRCECCDEICENDESVQTEDGEVCQSCADNDYCSCERCGDLFHNDSDTWVQVGDEMWCDSCAQNHATRCDCCGEWYEDDCVYEIDGEDVCEDCRDNGDFYSCEECGDIHHVDNMRQIRGDMFCEYCAERMNDGVIGDYHSHDIDNLQFFGDNHENTVPYMGVELEIDQGSNHESTAEAIIDIMPDNFIYMETDGSLNDGFENITHPATLEYHYSIKDSYKKMFKLCVRNHFRSHDTTTCGLHVHFNRAFYGDEQDECITRLLYLTERFWDEMTKFSRRKMSGLTRWANKYDKEPTEIVADMKTHRLGRYYAVNLTNTNTIEFRMFRGTLNLNTYIATLQLCHNLVVMSKTITDPEKLQAVVWTDLLDTEELKTYWETVKDRVMR